MDYANIKKSIESWTAILKDNAALIDRFGDGNSFLFDKPDYKLPSDQIHVYPGIYKGRLNFFLIPAAYDNAVTTNIEKYITVCEAGWVVGSNRIPSAEARLRIDAWSNNYKTWVPQQTATPDGMFQAFTIASVDFEQAQTKLTLGLQAGSAQIPIVDMIVTNLDDTKVYFDDYAKSVPPFGGAEAAANNFYLLS